MSAFIRHAKQLDIAMKVRISPNLTVQKGDFMTALRIFETLNFSG